MRTGSREEINSIKVIQVNIDRVRAAHDFLLVTARKEDVDLLLVGEFNRKRAKNSGFITDTRQDTGHGNGHM